jgi:hypothetical protein
MIKQILQQYWEIWATLVAMAVFYALMIALFSLEKVS